MSKINNLKFLSIGLILGGVLFSGMSNAAPIETNLKAVYNNIKIIVDGNVLTPTDSDGSIVEPFIVDGTTYLPIRAVANAVGKEVRWEPSTNTVHLGIPPIIEEIPKVPDKVVGMDTLQVFQSDNNNTSYFTNKNVSNTDFVVRQKNINPEINYFTSKYVEASSTYILDKKYSKLEGKFACQDVTKDYCSLTIYKNAAIAPTNVLFQKMLKKGDEPVKFSLSVESVDKAIFSLNGKSARPVIWDVTLTQPGYLVE
jgi:hypothetical protein